MLHPRPHVYSSASFDVYHHPSHDQEVTMSPHKQMSSSFSFQIMEASNRSSSRRCNFPDCEKTAKPGGFCISHGGGKKCKVDGCTTSVVSRGFCVAHGGGKRCQRDGCTKSAQTGGFCWIHGGGKKCGYQGCTKRAQSGGACISHGGGKRCRIEGCQKVVQYEGLCVGHGGFRRCLSVNCAKKALANGYCPGHGGNSMCMYDHCDRKAARGGYCTEHKLPINISSSKATEVRVTDRTEIFSKRDEAVYSSLSSTSRSRSSSPGQDCSTPTFQPPLYSERTNISILRRLPSIGSGPMPFEAIRELPSMKILPSVSLGIKRTYSPLSSSSSARLEEMFLAKPAPVSFLRYNQPHTMGTTRVVSMRVEKKPKAYRAEEEILKRQCPVVGCVRYAKIMGKCLLHTCH